LDELIILVYHKQIVNSSICVYPYSIKLFLFIILLQLGTCLIISWRAFILFVNISWLS